MEIVTWIALGLAAGAISTLAGLGGGLLMTLALAALVGPQRALAMAAPALLMGNVHRVWLYRRFIDRALAMPFVLGAFPGALVGGLLAVALPGLGRRFLDERRSTRLTYAVLTLCVALAIAGLA